MGAVLLLRKDDIAAALTSPSADRMADELLRAAERADLCSAKNAVGTGLRGEYFAKEGMQGPAQLVRVDEVIDFDRSVGAAANPRAASIASVRWSGWLKASISGAYRFHADAPNMQIVVARQIVAGAGARPGEKMDLAAGRFYPIEIRVTQLTESDRRIQLEWTAPHGARYVVPRALLHPPTETVAVVPKV
ncbi:PA14 domain-containing protein [Hydrogenophaga sp.]